MVGAFDVLVVGDEKLVRVIVSDPRRVTANPRTGRRWPLLLLDTVVSEAEALSLALHSWDDAHPCWQEADERRTRVAHDSYWRSKVGVYDVLRKLRAMEWLSNEEMNFLGSLPGNIPEDIAELYNAHPRWPIRAMIGVVARRQEKLRQLENSLGAASGS
jgi:hypothetical protein